MIQDITFLLTDHDVSCVSSIMQTLNIRSSERALRTACKTYDFCANIVKGGERLLVRNGYFSHRKPIAFPQPFNDPNIFISEDERTHPHLVRKMNARRLEELRLYAELATRHELMSLMIRFLNYVADLHNCQHTLFRESDACVDRIRFDFLI